MLWAVVVVVILGAGVPAAGLWFARKPRPLDSADRGYGEVDRWLVDQFGLGWHDRSQVRAAILAGRAVSGPRLEAATRGLAVQVVEGRFRTWRTARLLGWFHLVLGPAYTVFAIVWLIVAHRDGQRAFAVLAMFDGAVLTTIGVYYAFLQPKRVRRNAERILRSSSGAVSPGR